VKRIRIHKPRAGREHSWPEVLPADPRDPDVVRAKTLAQARTPCAKLPVVAAMPMHPYVVEEVIRQRER
jgi:hypothetical protein